MGAIRVPFEVLWNVVNVASDQYVGSVCIVVERLLSTLEHNGLFSVR